MTPHDRATQLAVALKSIRDDRAGGADDVATISLIELAIAEAELDKLRALADAPDLLAEFCARFVTAGGSAAHLLAVLRSTS